MDTEALKTSTGVADDPARSPNLPAWAYLDPDVYEREKHEIFYRTWAYAGWVGDLRAPGDYITAELLDQSVIVMRGRDGALQGFHNVCQHRGHRLLEDRGNVAAITCPYHAWVYDLDGSLKRARATERTADFDRSCFSLKPVRVEVLADKFVLFNLDANAEPLGPRVEDFVADVRRELTQFDRLVKAPARPRTEEEQQRYDEYFPIRANWKIVMDNFLECYHCPPAHPGFLRDLTFDDLTYTGHDLWAKQKSGTRRSDGDRQMFWTLFPGFVFWNSGTREKQSIHAMNFVVPEGPALTRAGRMDVYRLPEEIDTEEWRPDWGDVGAEDKSLCESVQRGLASLGYDQGRIIHNPDDGNSEGAMHAFQRFVVRALGI